MPKFTYKSRTSDATYETLVSADGKTASCNCPGWTQHDKRNCWHVRDALAGGKQAVTRSGPAAPPRNSKPYVADIPAERIRVGFITPMLADSAPFTAGEAAQALARYTDRYYLEEKFDGWRIVAAVRTNGVVVAWTREGNRHVLPDHIVRVLTNFPAGTYDGELIVPGGYSSNVNDASYATQLRLVLFDVMRLDDEDLTQLPFTQRRRRLEAIANVLHKRRITAVTVSQLFPADWTSMQAIWNRRGARTEGVMLKRAAAPYQPGRRGTDWLKLKRTEWLDMRIVGFEAGSLGPCAVVKLEATVRDGRKLVTVATTVKTKDTRHRTLFATNPKAFEGRWLRIEHRGLNGSKPRSPMFDRLIDAPPYAK
jgi:ATP-dependent DNA ligase